MKRGGPGKGGSGPPDPPLDTPMIVISPLIYHIISKVYYYLLMLHYYYSLKVTGYNIKRYEKSYTCLRCHTILYLCIYSVRLKRPSHLCSNITS